MTIEERANKYGTGFASDEANSAASDGYIHGATEQSDKCLQWVIEWMDLCLYNFVSESNGRINKKELFEEFKRDWNLELK